MSDMPKADFVGSTRLVSREDGTTGTCALCTRDTHLGVRIDTESVTTLRKVSTFVCYDCTEVAALTLVGRMACVTCRRV